jgi:uncharacterized protein
MFQRMVARAAHATRASATIRTSTIRNHMPNHAAATASSSFSNNSSFGDSDVPAPTFPQRVESSYEQSKKSYEAAYEALRNDPTQAFGAGNEFDNFIQAETDPDAMAKTEFNAYTNNIFDINDIYFHGAIMCLPHTVLKVNIETVQDITVDVLSIFELLVPKVDLIFFGSGATNCGPLGLNEDVYEWLREREIGYEVRSSQDALSTFHMLNEEDRLAACIALPVFEELDDDEHDPAEWSLGNHY